MPLRQGLNKAANKACHPSGLTGKEIGLWYRDMGRKRKQEAIPASKNDKLKEKFDKSLPFSLKPYAVELCQKLLQIAPKSATISTHDEVVSSNLTVKNSDAHLDLFAEQFQMANDSELLPVDKLFLSASSKIDHLSSNDECHLKQRWLTQKKTAAYRRMLSFRKKLPTFQQRHRIIEAIGDHKLVVISGDTGCGKSTQVPQLVLDDCLERGQGARTFVLVTQPRRISAISLSERVAHERAEALGNSVGYQIRFDGACPRNFGSILYCTHGIALQYMLTDNRLSRVSHLIIDEVHERNIDSDLLLILVRDLLVQRPDLKVVLMSATMNADFFVDYFSQLISKNDVALVQFEGRCFPVESFFLEHVIDKLSFENKLQVTRRAPKDLIIPQGQTKQQAIKDHWKRLDNFIARLAKEGKFSSKTLSTLKCWEDQPEIVNTLIVQLTRHIVQTTDPSGSILIFVPGWGDISKLIDLFNADTFFKSGNFHFVPVHSLLPPLEQKKVFESMPENHRKIVIATNIAETSITIDDVVYVIDTGKANMSNFDPESNIQTLRRALDELKDMGALTNDEQLTPLGRKLVHFPVDPVCGKMLIYGTLFSCLDPMLTVVACLEHKAPFFRPFGDEQAYSVAKKRISKGFKSDHLTWLQAVNQYDDCLVNYGFKAARSFANDHFLSTHTIDLIGKLKRQFTSVLGTVGFVSSGDAFHPEDNRHSYDMTVVLAILGAGMYPRVGRNIAGRGHSAISDKPARFTSKLWKSGRASAGSVNAKEPFLDTQLGCYFEAMRLSGITLFDISILHPIIPLLFCGRLDISTKFDGKTLMIVDDWLDISCDDSTAILVARLKSSVSDLLTKYHMDIFDNDDRRFRNLLCQLFAFVYKDIINHQETGRHVTANDNTDRVKKHEKSKAKGRHGK